MSVYMIKKTILCLLATAVIGGCSVNEAMEETKAETSETTGSATSITVVLPNETAVSETVTENTSEIVAETIPEPRADLKRIEKALTDTEKFSLEIDEICKKYYVAGMTMAVFAEGGIIYTKSYGYSDKEKGISACDDTKYRAASVSKTVTAVLAMILSDEGLLDLDAPISGITGIELDMFQEAPNTARNLMTHTSNIMDSYAYEHAFDYNPPMSLSKMAANYNLFSYDIPGSRYLYSNFGAGLMSAVIESVTGERFYAYAESALFEKLGMDAGYLRTLINDTENIANIYKGGVLAHNVKGWGRTEKYYDQIPLGQQYALGQCELIISAPDLAKVGIMLSGDGKVDGVSILSEEKVKEMNEPYITVNEKNFSESYACGLRINNGIVEGRTITGHPGQALGMVGGLYFDKSDGTGVALLTNGCSVSMKENGMYGINDDIVKAVYRYFFG